jgi:hypothetical protein
MFRWIPMTNKGMARHERRMSRSATRTRQPMNRILHGTAEAVGAVVKAAKETVGPRMAGQRKCDSCRNGWGEIGHGRMLLCKGCARTQKQIIGKKSYNAQRKTSAPRPRRWKEADSE